MVLLLGAVTWLLAGAAAIGLAVLGRAWLLSRLPPLAIDADALGGALTAMSGAMLAVGVAHVALLVGLARGWRWVQSAGALGAAVLAAVLLGLSAAAVSSAVRDAAYAWLLMGAALLAAVGTVGYAMVAMRLVRELGSETIV